jgi:serine phosphatase RsbU (regulator of sigma subunit)
MKPALEHDIGWLQRSVQSLTGELLRVYEELTLLYELGRQIGPLADEDQIASAALREAIDILSADCGWVALWDEGTFRVPKDCRIEIEVGTVDNINRSVFETLYHRREGEFLSHTFDEEFHLGEVDVPARFLASSLTVGDRWRGYMCLGRKRTGPIFLSDDQKLFNAVAFLVAAELENLRSQRSELEKERLANELEMARGVQRSLLPRNFSCTDFLEAAGVSEPCFEIGGDFFDLIPIGTDLCLLVIADVSGKGPPAALQAAMVQGIVQATSRSSPELSFLMETLNECILARSVEGRFVTAVAATLDSTGCLHYTNGGHTRPILIRTDGQVIELVEGGPILGIFENSSYPEGSVQLRPGDLLLLYTDGVTEAEDPQGNAFGTARLLEWAQGRGGQRLSEIKESLIDTVRRFGGGGRQADDLTVLLVQYKAPGVR